MIAELTDHQTRLGKPPQDAASNDPRQRVRRTLVYLTNNASHMNYHAYRRDGLPITSSHIESTVKLINRRIKGNEKFWLRWQADQIGSNHYRTAS